MASSSIRYLRRFSTSIPITLTNAKSIFRRDHDPDKVLAIYSSVADRCSSPIVSRYVLDVTVRRLAKARRFSDIESLLESRKADAKIKEELYLSSLIRSYGIAGMFGSAMKTFEEMDALGTPRSAISFNAILLACNNSKLFDRVPKLFDEIPKRYGLSPDGLSYAILVEAYCEKGLTDKAIETIGEIESNGIAINAATLTTLIDALYKKGLAGEAEKLWQSMVAKGVEVDIVAYNVRIGHNERSKPEDVKAMIEEMKNSGLKPNARSYSYLITCYCRNGMIDEAMKVYKGLAGEGLGPNPPIFGTLVYYLCWGGDFERGYEVFKRSVGANMIPHFKTTRFLVEGLAERKMVWEAEEVLRTAKKQKYPPNMSDWWKKVEERLGLAPGD